MMINHHTYDDNRYTRFDHHYTHDDNRDTYDDHRYTHVITVTLCG